MSAGSAFGVRGTILFLAGGSSLLFVAPSAQAVEAAPAVPSPPAAESAPPSPAAAPAAPEPPPSTPAPEPAPPAPEPTPAAAPRTPAPPIAAPPASNVESADRHDEDANPGAEDSLRRPQTYAGSVTIFSAADLDRTGATGIANLASMTPFMEIGEQEGNLELYVRGVGSSDNAELGDPATATFIDGVYIPRPRGVRNLLFDLERIELKRGPQGALRGHNTLAGSLDIVTARPVLRVWGANASLQLGNYSQRVGRGMLNVPLGERAALRVAAAGETRAPFYENAGPIRELRGSESADNLAFRSTLSWAPLARLSVTLRQDYQQANGTGSTGSYLRSATEAGILPQEVSNPRTVVLRSPQGGEAVKHWGLSGNIEADLGPALVRYQGSYRDLNFRQTNGGTAGVAVPNRDDYDLDNASTTYWHQRSKSVAQELSIRSPATSRLRWRAGGAFFDEEQKYHFATVADKSTGFAGVEFTMPKVHYRSWSGFADGAFDIFKFLRATAGFRFTTENKTRSGLGLVSSWSGIGTPFRFGTDGFAYADQGRRSFSAQPADSMAPFDIFRNGIRRFGARDTLSDAIAQPGVTWTGVAVDQRGSYSDSFIDFHLGVDADVAKDHLVYLTVASGHKAGAFDEIVYPTGATVTPSYRSDALYSVEAGTKNDFLQHSLIANLSAFASSYARLNQAPTVFVIQDSALVAASVRSRITPSARILGIEAEVAARLPLGFLARLSTRLLDARFMEGVIVDDRADAFGFDRLPTKLEGKVLPRAPVLAINYSIAEAIPTAVGTFDWVVSAQTKTKQYLLPFNGEGKDFAGNPNPLLSDVVPGYTRLDVGAGFAHPGGKLRVDAFINNLTNVTYAASMIPSTSPVQFFNPPRQVGVRLSLAM
jgi:iron complex outermembrane receptor protein